MVKGCDQDGHKDQDYDERKPWKYVKDQSDGQNRGKAHRYIEQHDAAYHHMRFSRDKEQQQEVFRDFEGCNSSSEWGSHASESCGKKSETGGWSGNFSGKIQKEPYALGRDRRQGVQAYEERIKGYEGGSCTSGFGQKDMDQYTPPTDFRVTRQRNMQIKCQERLFPGTETMMQNKKANPVLSNQLESINRITSGLANATYERMKHKVVANLDVTEGLDATATPVNKIQTVPVLETKLHASGMVHAAHERTENKFVTDGLLRDKEKVALTTSNKIQTVPACDKTEKTPVNKISVSDSVKTPFQKSSSRQDSTGAHSRVSSTREKSCTPTLTDLENSVNYDCRCDKVLRVALDYALPEERA